MGNHSSGKRMADIIARLTRLGITPEDSWSLRRAAMTLTNWHIGQCGNSSAHSSWAIVRDDETEKTYMEIIPHNGNRYRVAIPDREAGARKRVEKILSKYPGLHYYVQTDPRGASLYVVEQKTLDLYQRPIDEIYNQGVAVW